MVFQKFLLLVLIFSTLITLTFSTNYYADINIDISSDGFVTVDGITNYDFLNNIKNSQNFTSKKANIWTFNLSTNEKIDDFIFELSLPENAVITYIKTTPTFRIEDEENKIKLIGTGENKPLTIIIQYSINYKASIFSKNNIIAFLAFTIIITFIFLALLVYKYINREKIMKKQIDILLKNPNNYINNNLPEIKNISYSYDKSILSDRQKAIISILKKEGKISQKELEKKMNIPKSSLSRNIQSLISKKIIQKE
ncbi:MAG: MarR family transcriptional regulator, partial [Nanoarchaeota archaeon]|nr:MarR family transcriptional regulator [Nanoarchaeota archaeon]